MLTLSKSDFKVAQSCVTKLYYKKMRYPTTNDANEYMQLLAEGGYMVGKLAQLLYTDGIEVTDDNTKTAVEKTNALLQQPNVTIFEAAIKVQQFIIRIDILQKIGDEYRVIEVKSKSFDSYDTKALGGSAFKPYIEDVLFQQFVLELYLKENNLLGIVSPYLLLPDKSKTTAIEGLCGWFTKKQTLNLVPTGGFKKIEYDFNFPLNSKQHLQLIQDDLLTLVSVAEQSKKTLALIKNAALKFATLLKASEPLKEQATINLKCFKCEYKTDAGQSGYNECWGKLANSTPHISELYYLGSAPMGNKANALITEGKTNLFDIKTEDCFTKDGTVGNRDERRIIQLENTKNNTEFFKANAKAEIKNWNYPLYFIDFETSTNALPFHTGMRPYETIAFQWSCHVLENETAEPKHYEWINTDMVFPNFKFAESLMQCIGSNGTPLMWSHHENTVLSHILQQMGEREYDNANLKNWLYDITKSSKKGEERDGRLLDMCKFCADNYFHPYMKGRVSIKKVLPAIWNHNNYLHQVSYLKKYVEFKDGVILDPYKTLKPLSDIIENDEADEENTDAYGIAIKEGTAAMRAYYQMMFEVNDKPKEQDAVKKMLLQYCELDTMAMLIIWKHWLRLAKA